MREKPNSAPWETHLIVAVLGGGNAIFRCLTPVSTKTGRLTDRHTSKT
jgi:hypothetical protein